MESACSSCVSDLSFDSLMSVDEGGRFLMDPPREGVAQQTLGKKEGLHGPPDQGSREGSEIPTGIKSTGNNEK